MSDNTPTGRITPIDTTVASTARVYDAMLGGKDNYEVDRINRDQLLEVAPELKDMTQDHREWLIRVTRFMAGNAGLSQFIDCGSGLPSAENTHEAAQRLNPDAEVVYVDIDPIVLAHGRALLEENSRTRFIQGDLTRPTELLADPVLGKHIDWNTPLGLIQIGTMHHVTDEQQPLDVMAAYVDALPSGSFVAISHFYNPRDGSELSKLAERLEKAFLGGSIASGRFRTYDEIDALFSGLEYVDPGLSVLADWWPDGPRNEPLADVQRLILGGVARKP